MLCSAQSPQLCHLPGMCKPGLQSEGQPQVPCILPVLLLCLYHLHPSCFKHLYTVAGGLPIFRLTFFRQCRRGSSGGQACEQCKHTQAIQLLVSFSTVSSVLDVFTNTLKLHFSNCPLFNVRTLHVSKMTHTNQGYACAWSLSWVLYKETVLSPQFLHQLLQALGLIPQDNILLISHLFFLMIYQKTKTNPKVKVFTRILFLLLP